MSGNRRALLAVSWVVLAALGFMAGRWTESRLVAPAAVPAAATRPATVPSVASAGAVATTGVVPENPEPAPVAVEGESEAMAGASRPALPTGTILVRVVNERGEPEAAVDVYALLAGAPGVEDVEDVPNARTDDDGFARLEVMAGIRHDVGAVSYGARDMARDVVVATGGTVSLDFTLRYGSPVRVRIAGWPPPGPGRWEARVNLVTVSESDDFDGFQEVPGRTESVAYHEVLEFKEGAEDVCLFHPPGARFRFSATVGCHGEKVGEYTYQAGVRLDPVEGILQDGESLQLRVTGAPVVNVHLVPDPPLPPGWRAAGFLRLQQGARRVTVDLAPRGKKAIEGYGLLTGEGPFTVTWGPPEDGASISYDDDTAVLDKGSREFPEAAHGMTCEVIASWKAAPPGTETPTVARKGVPLLLIGDAKAERGGKGLSVHTWNSVDDRGDPRLHECLPDYSIGEMGLPGLDPSQRGDWLIAWRGPFAVSEALRVPAEGSMEVPLRPAGLLILAPERLERDGLGALRIRRSDGVPLHVSDNYYWDDEGYMVSALLGDPQVLPGRFLGPLPAGPLRFEVRRGGVRLRDATVTVRAGKFTLFEVPEVPR